MNQFPANFDEKTLQPLESTPPAQPGQRRVAKRFDIKFNTLADSTIDILFSKQVNIFKKDFEHPFKMISRKRLVQFT